MSEDRPGFEDTPLLPDVDYHVHDPSRPHPPHVEPGNTVSSPPPSDAVTLFDGDDLDGWEAVDGGEPGWCVDDDELVIVPETGDLCTTTTLGDCQLHVEWATPVEQGDARYPGNSGVFLADRYELQILDCYDTTIYADGYTGAIYGQHPPLVNACRRPGEWQSFDIIWHNPTFDGDALTAPASVSALHNGVLIHDGAEPHGPTTYRDVQTYDQHGPAPLRLQDHGFPVRFRNIWYRPL